MAGGPSTARSPAQTRRSASRWLGANETHGGWCGCGRHGHRHELWRGLHRWTRWTAGQLGHDARRDSTVVATSGSGEACPRRSDDEECGGGGGWDAPHSGARLRCCWCGVRRWWRGRRGPQREHRGETAAEHRRRWGCGRRRRSRAGGEAELRGPQVRASGGEAGEGAHHRRGCRLVRAGVVIDRRTEKRGWSDGSGHGRQNAGLGHYGRTMPEFGQSSSRCHGASSGSCRLLKLTLMAARRGAAGRLHTGAGAFDVVGTPSSYDSRKSRPRSRGVMGTGRSDGTHRVGAASGWRDRGGAGWSGGPVDGRLCACGWAAAGRDGRLGKGMIRI
jgi:hypothetical protein